MAKFTAYQIADYIVASVDAESGDIISNLKLQKLLYYAQGFHLALNDGEPLFDDPIVAWTHGPAVPELYRHYKSYGYNAIPPCEGADLSGFDAEDREFLDEILDVYGQFSAWKLRDMTYAEPPWKDASAPGAVISHESMRNYFRTLLING